MRHCGNVCESRKSCRTQTALTCDQLIFTVANGTHGERLQDAVACDGLAQLLQCRLIKLTARLESVRPNQLHGNFGRIYGRDLLCGGRQTGLCDGRRIRRRLPCDHVFPQAKCAEPTPETAGLSFLHAS